MKYFVKMFDKTFGPLDEEKIRQMYQDNKIENSTEISRDKVEWSRVVDVLSHLIREKVTGNVAPSYEELPSVSPPIPVAQQANPTPLLEQPIWFYSTDGKSGFGPVTRTRIGELIQQGQLNRKSLVWLLGEGSRYLEAEPQLSGLLNVTSSNPFITSPLISTPPIPQSMPDASMNASIMLEQMFSSERNAEEILDTFSSPSLNKSVRTGMSHPPIPQSDISRSTYVLLALFLGCFGVHNFYARRTVIGLYELLAGMTSVTLIIIIFLACLITGSSGSPFFMIPLLIYVSEFIWIICEICSVTEDGAGQKMS